MSRHYIKNVPLYIAVVLAASVPSTILFRWVRVILTERIQGKERRGKDSSQRKEPLRIKIRQWKKKKALQEPSRFRKYRTPVTALLLMAVFCILLTTGQTDGHIVVMNRLEIRVPEYFALEHNDRDSSLYKCTGKGKKTAFLIVDARIPDASERKQGSLESLESCGWLTEQEAYTNPQGVRMIRGIVITNGIRERRYYIECENSHLMVIRMSEDDRYYNVQDCEEAMRQTADSIRPVK